MGACKLADNRYAPLLNTCVGRGLFPNLFMASVGEGVLHVKLQLIDLEGCQLINDHPECL